MNPIFRICNFLNKESVPYAIVGGYAVALHGAIRGTVDLDVIIAHTQKDFVACERALRDAGLIPRLPVTAVEVFQFRKEYIEKRNLIAWSFYNPKNPIEIFDVIIPHDLLSYRVIIKNMNGMPLKVLAIDDLIKIKLQAGRPQDLEDVKSLRSLQR